VSLPREPSERRSVRADVDRARTAPVAVVNFMNYEGWEWRKIAVGDSLVMAPVLVFSLAVRRIW
jgi:hypothetical protein